MYKLDLPTHDAHITIWYLCCRCAIYGRRDEGHTTVDVDFEISKRNQSVKRAPRSRHKTHTSINVQATQRNLRPRHIEEQPDLSRYNVQASLHRSAPCDTCAYGWNSSMRCATLVIEHLRPNLLSCVPAQSKRSKFDWARHTQTKIQAQLVLHTPHVYQLHIKLRSDRRMTSTRHTRLKQKPHLKTHRTRCAHERVFFWSQASWNHNESVTCKKGTVLESTHHMSGLQAIGQRDTTFIADFIAGKTQLCDGVVGLVMFQQTVTTTAVAIAARM